MYTGPLFVSVFGLKTSEIALSDAALLCLHGVEAHGVRFIGLAELLPEATIVAPDLRGHGRSPKRGPWTVDQHVRDVAPLLRRMGPRTIVVGHSFGGLVAWELARYAHDQLRALVLVDPAIGMDAAICAEQARVAGDPPRWNNADAAFDAMMVGRDQRAAWSVALDVAVGLHSDGDGWLRRRVAPEAVQSVWRDVAVPLADSAWRGPTLLIEAGREAGAYVSSQLVRDLREQLGDRLEHVVIDAPHAIPADAPDLLAEQISQFLERIGR